MCCQFYIDYNTMQDILRVVDDAAVDISSFGQRDIHPTDPSVIITGDRSGDFQLLRAQEMRWGFPGFDGKQLLINARAESAVEKKSFRDSVLRRRCVIPAGHFYEWDRTKTKIIFTCEGSSSLYMAGFYNYFHSDQGANGKTGKRGGIDEFRFIILTTEANESMKPVHDRMPLILPENQIRDWIFDDGMVGEILEQSSPMLSRYQEYEQLTLF